MKRESQPWGLRKDALPPEMGVPYEEKRLQVLRGARLRQLIQRKQRREAVPELDGPEPRT